jgi:hypothetical protein
MEEIHNLGVVPFAIYYSDQMKGICGGSGM